ncbi:hypothetical protein DFH09DRAFT_1081722 [Mycena vulgaris]|nr:hypothetical protein DFH09DRAFT_1081722 [Mycena vulgaris]
MRVRIFKSTRVRALKNPSPKDVEPQPVNAMRGRKIEARRVAAKSSRGSKPASSEFEKGIDFEFESRQLAWEYGKSLKPGWTQRERERERERDKAENGAVDRAACAACQGSRNKQRWIHGGARRAGSVRVVPSLSIQLVYSSAGACGAPVHRRIAGFVGRRTPPAGVMRQRLCWLWRHESRHHNLKAMPAPAGGSPKRWMMRWMMPGGAMISCARDNNTQPRIANEDNNSQEPGAWIRTMRLGIGTGRQSGVDRRGRGHVKGLYYCKRSAAFVLFADRGESKVCGGGGGRRIDAREERKNSESGGREPEEKADVRAESGRGESDLRLAGGGCGGPSVEGFLKAESARPREDFRVRFPLRWKTEQG